MIKVKGIEITNPSRVVLNKNKITKLDVINYYNDMSDKIMLFLRNRPISVIRCHNELNTFFKKHPIKNENVEKFLFKSKQPYFYLLTKKQLIMQSQMGTIEFHSWASTIKKINSPNYMVFDLDPDENLSHSKLKKGALLLKQVLDQLGLISFLKTSGGKGYHVYVPLKNVKNYNILFKFSEKVAKILENSSSIFTTNIRKENRKNKIFIDVLRNKQGATCASPYSLRIKNNLTVSMPIFWEDIDKIKPNQITIKNYKQYLNNSWANFFKINQSIT